MVAVSLWYLFEKRIAYWHWSNASLVPYFALFASTRQFMLAGLQASYLIFGVHGLFLWRLESARDRHGRRFNEIVWYQIGWILSLAIFAYTVKVTDFVDGWAGLEFIIVSLSLVANWATTRKWVWSWPVWLVVNALQAVYFEHWQLWGQFGLQFVLFSMSVWGWIVWHRERRTVRNGSELSRVEV
jgi:nicotinamide mononucleotide transporter